MAEAAQTADASDGIPAGQTPRLVLYAQTHDHNGQRVSLLPLVTDQTGVTHLIVGCLHLHDTPGVLRLNDHDPNDARFDALWSEVKWLQGAGIKVLLMVGGASQGSYQKLAGDQASFEAFYTPVLDLLRRRGLDGVDLDVEEVVEHKIIKRLLLRVRQDLGPQFLVTMAPVATAMIPDPKIPISIPVFALLPSLPHLSGFSYFRLESDPQLKQIISWYNVQFYCGWGDASQSAHYDMIIRAGWDPSRVVMGVVTNPNNGSGYVNLDQLLPNITRLRQLYPSFGGVMGWEYFNAGMQREDWDKPTHWIKELARVVRAPQPATTTSALAAPSGSTPQVQAWNEKDVQWVMEMGFDRQRAESALDAAGGNVEQAINILFGE